MLYKENWDETQKRFDAFWNKEYNGRCNISMQVLKGKPSGIEKQFDVVDRYTNGEVIDIISRDFLQNRHFMAEAIPAKYINFGTCGHCEFYGCKPIYKPNTVWYDPILDEPDSSFMDIDLKNNEAFEKQKNVVADWLSHAKNDYFVSMTDNVGIVDALAEITGTENLLCDMLDEPEFVEESLKKITKDWKASTIEFYEMLKENNLGGSTHGWMQVWARGLHSQIQCDFSVMISPSLFEEFVLPELEETSSALDFCSYHLDGIQELRHLDMILSVKKIDNIQWTHVAGQPSTSNYIPEFQKMQKAGKGLILAPKLDEVEDIMKNLSHKGLHLNIHGVKDEEMAKDIIKMAEKYAHE